MHRHRHFIRFNLIGTLALTLAAAGGARGSEPLTFSGELKVPIRLETDPALLTPSLSVWLGDDEAAVASRRVGGVGTLTIRFSGSQTQPLTVNEHCPRRAPGARLKVTGATPGTEVVATFVPDDGSPVTLGAYTLSERVTKATAGICA